MARTRRRRMVHSLFVAMIVVTVVNGTDYRAIPVLAGVTLVVLVDRGGRELPIEPAFSAARITLPAEERVSLGRDDATGQFTFHFERV